MTAALLEAHALTIETPGGRTLVRELNVVLEREWWSATTPTSCRPSA
jgi:hypothetical protein